MKTIKDLMKYEFSMSIMRPGTWLGFGFVFLLYTSKLLFEGVPSNLTELMVLQTAGRIAGNLNLFLPVISGIVSADRISRDFILGIFELQKSTVIRRWHYIFGKFLGSLFALLFIQFLIFISMTVILILCGMPTGLLFYILMTFLSITVPATLFVLIFSLTFPLLIPVRVYQILFTGYWIWGNFLDPAAIPSISDSILNASGRYANEVIFKVVVGRNLPVSPELIDLVQNWIVLVVFILGGFMLLGKLLKIRREG